MQPAEPRDAPGRAVLSDGDGGLGGRAYLVAAGRRHWIPDAARLRDYGLRWPEDVRVVPSTEIARYPLGAPIPERVDAVTFARPPRGSTAWQMREICASQLSGSGIEFGAGANPFPVPYGCSVAYLDHAPLDELESHAYAGQHEFVALAGRDSLDVMATVADGSVDFVIACHVIEHVVNPLGALAAALRVLRPGGSLVLVVPDKHRTFDAPRPLTDLDHLLLDFRRPDRERDAEHVDEFFRLAFRAHAPPLESGRDAGDVDVHYHVWDYPHFLHTVLLAEAEGIARWSSIWSQPTVTDPTANEFYVVLRK